MPMATLVGGPAPFYGLVSRTTETLQEVGRGVAGISALFPYESKDVRLGGPQSTLRQFFHKDSSPPWRMLYPLFLLRQPLNSVLTTGHQRERP